MYIIEIMLPKNSMKVLCFVDLIKNLNWLRPRHFTKIIHAFSSDQGFLIRFKNNCENFEKHISVFNLTLKEFILFPDRLRF